VIALPYLAHLLKIVIKKKLRAILPFLNLKQNLHLRANTTETYYYVTMSFKAISMLLLDRPTILNILNSSERDAAAAR
jgi:hypothetical protein